MMGRRLGVSACRRASHNFAVGRPLRALVNPQSEIPDVSVVKSPSVAAQPATGEDARFTIPFAVRVQSSGLGFGGFLR
jgi:hypothetical protein